MQQGFVGDFDGRFAGGRVAVHREQTVCGEEVEERPVGDGEVAAQGTSPSRGCTVGGGATHGEQWPHGSLVASVQTVEPRPGAWGWL